jgi:hypothetical protein
MLKLCFSELSTSKWHTDKRGVGTIKMKKNTAICHPNYKKGRALKPEELATWPEWPSLA